MLKNYALQCRCLNCTLPEVKFCVKNEKIEKNEKNEKICDNLRQPVTTWFGLAQEFLFSLEA